MLPSTIPIFPLPTVVLFPNVFLPLHIFERRYRQMVTEAIAGDRLIGMVLLQPGFDAEYEGCPPTYDIGCAGLITHAERLPDGRFNIVLQGLEKFRIVGEHEPTDKVLYRQALVNPVSEAILQSERETLGIARRKLELLLEPLFTNTRGAGLLPAGMKDEDLINALAQYLDLEPIEKQALLEDDGPVARCNSLVKLLEMKAMGDAGASGPGILH